MEYLEFRINLWKSRDFTRGGKDNHRSTSKLIQPSEVNRFQLGYKGTKVISRAVPFIIRSDRRGNSRLELPRIIIFPLSAWQDRLHLGCDRLSESVIGFADRKVDSLQVASLFRVLTVSFPFLPPFYAKLAVRGIIRNNFNSHFSLSSTINVDNVASSSSLFLRWLGWLIFLSLVNVNIFLCSNDYGLSFFRACKYIYLEEESVERNGYDNFQETVKSIQRLSRI